MELKDTIERRRSVRHFTSEEVALDDLKEMIRRAGLTPSVNNSQPWKFIVVRNRELLIRMADAVSVKIADLPVNESRIAENVKSQVEWFSTFFRNAPAVIALAMEKYESILEKGVRLSHEEINRTRNYPDFQSAGACIQTILLSAVEMGYGSCWLSGPMVAKEELEKILQVAEPLHLVAFVAIGKAQKDPVPKKKKPLDEILQVID